MKITKTQIKITDFRAGLKHVQHLYAIFQQNGLETPKLLSRRYRNGFSEN